MKFQLGLTSLKKSKQVDNIFPVLQDEQVRQYPKDFQTKFCIVPIDKASEYELVVRSSQNAKVF